MWKETLHVSDEDEECYQYGLELTFSTLFNLGWMFLISVVMGKTWAFLIYAAVYVPMRLYAGGYHAADHFRCILFSVSSFAVCMGLSFVQLEYIHALLICTMISVVSLAGFSLIAPLESENKPITNKQRKRAKRNLVVLQIILMFFLMLSVFQGQLHEFILLAFYTEFSVLFSVFIGFLNKRKKKKMSFT